MAPGNEKNKKKRSRIVSIADFRRSSNPYSGDGSKAGTGMGTDGNSNSGNMFCQPIGSSKSNAPPRIIPTLVIPSLPQSDVCQDTMKRILIEFEPIIRRRGYNVRSISEFCCCGDGMDQQQRGGRKRKIMGSNVLGYNMTTRSGSYKAHTIHLRLSNPRNHSILFPYEDVASTMAHELSHCVHGPHNKAFFALMEEILEEHANLQIHGPYGPSFLKPTNAGTIGRTPAGMPSAFETSSAGGGIVGQGQRLGGGGKGRSKLLDLEGTGRKLGGGQGGRTYNPKQLRDLVLQAAEARKRQMDRIRRAIEKSKEQCVIEILDDSDDEDEGNKNNNVNITNVKRPGVNNLGLHGKGGESKSTKQQRNAPSIKKETGKSDVPSSKKRPQINNSDHQPRHSKSKAAKKGPFSKDVEVVDLISDDDDDDDEEEKESEACIATWTCKTCTFVNQIDETECEMCLNRRT